MVSIFEEIISYCNVFRMGSLGSLDHQQKWRKEEIPFSIYER